MTTLELLDGAENDTKWFITNDITTWFRFGAELLTNGPEFNETIRHST